LLIAQVAATSPMLHTVNISSNNLGRYGPETARNLAMSEKIHTVNISYNDLVEYGLETARNLAVSGKIHTVILVLII
jgi:hypothetical protein